MKMDTSDGLPAGWDARLGLNGRLYYYSKQSQIVQILPPPEIWRCVHSLPYGWEMATDYNNTNYYINHITQTVTYEDPRTEDDQSIPFESAVSPDALLSPQPRECQIVRDPHMGFGFIAGSEKPVIIRSVTPGGPSEGKLLADDQIIKIDSENVMMADREHVIELIREKSEKVVLTVLQPNRSANSSFLNPAKKTFRTMDRPKVRFADDVIVGGQERTEGSSPLLVSPGVLRVELENKQTRSFRFQPETTAGDAVAALCDKLGFKDPNLFSFVLTPPVDSDKQNGNNGKSFFRVSTMSDQQPLCSSSPDSLLIAPWDCLAKVVNNFSVRHHSCHFRLEFMPKDFHKLSRNDPEAFRYLYQQCVNDVVSGDVYKSELSREELVKLAVIQVQELVLTSMPTTPPEKVPKKSSNLTENPLQRNAFRFSGISNKLTLKYIEKEYGLRRFLPPSIMSTMQKDNPTARNIRKSLQQYLKASYSTSFFSQHPTSPIIPTSPILTSGGNADAAILQLRLQYLKILSPQHLFGGRYFSASMQALMESDITILVGHNYGISQMINAKTKMVSVLAEFHHVTGFEVAPCPAESSKTTVRIEFAEKKDLILTMEPQAAHNFAFMVAGYCRVYGNIDMVLTLPMAESTSAPMYFGPHKVKPSYWNYPPVRSKSDGVHDSFLPSFFYCDFSEPITPAVLSQEKPTLSIPQKNGFHGPQTPPPVLKYSLDDEEEEMDIPVFESDSKPDNSDSNNNSSLRSDSHEATYEEIVTPLPESPTSSLSAGQYSDLSPTNSPTVHQGEIPTLNGYLVPTPPEQRTKRITADAEKIKRAESSGEGDWMDLMKALGKEEGQPTEQVEVNGAVGLQEDPDNFPPPPPPLTKANDQEDIVQKIVVPPPPNYPPPKRKESIRKEGDNRLTSASKSKSLDQRVFTKNTTVNMPEERQKASTLDGRNFVPDAENNPPAIATPKSHAVPPNPHMSSFKPNETELNVFSLTRNELGQNTVPGTSGSVTESVPTSTIGTPEVKSLGSIDDVHDPVTRRKLQETEDLIEYFRRKREEVVGSPSTNNSSNANTGNFDSSGELDTPIVVADIAAGNKRLRKAEKAATKNRKSWAASETTRKFSLEDEGPISMSNPDLTNATLHKKHNKSLFRRLFGDRKRRSHSMYEASGTSSAYGRRRRRFRFPKFRFRRAFSLNSTKKDNRKSVLPTSGEDTPSKSHNFRFRPFSHKKDTKSHGVLVISEPCDDVRGIDMLPSGKYTVAGTMFQANGDATETEIITLGSKRPSRESLVDKKEEENNKTNESNSVDDDDTTGVTLRTNSIREAKRPLSFSTFQQAVMEGYTDPETPKLASVDEGVRSSLPNILDQPSPCELSLTESSEALQEIVRAREATEQSHQRDEIELPGSKLLRQAKPPRKLIPAPNPVVPDETVRKTLSLPPGVHLSSTAPQATSTPIQDTKKAIKKRPSNKRPAPPPPIVKRETGDKGSKNEEKSVDDVLQNDWDEDTLFKRKSVESPSLVTEILSFLESSNADKAEADKSDAPFSENDAMANAPLPYGDDYVMPGVKSTSAIEADNKNENEYENEKDEVKKRTMYEMFYDEMMADHARLTLEKEGSASERYEVTDESDSDDSESEGDKIGSYDVTYENEITTDDVTTDDNEESKRVVLKLYEKYVDKNASWTDGEEELVTSSTDDSSDVTTQRDNIDSADTCEDESGPEYVNLQEPRRNSAKAPGSYSTYQNLISPSGYGRGFPGTKRTSFSKKPPLPPKPIFH